MRKTYTCEAWPFLHLGHIQFRDGLYTTEDEGIQDVIEGSESYGVRIFLLKEESLPQAPVEPVPDSLQKAEFTGADLADTIITEPLPKRRPGRPPTGARQGTRGTGNLQ